MKFRKKPVVIDAVIWNGENLKEVIDFTGKSPKWDEYFKSFEEYELFVKNDRSIFKIFTLEGTMEASVGDYIIRGVKGEHYPCKPDIFKATYELVGENCTQCYGLNWTKTPTGKKCNDCQTEFLVDDSLKQ